MLGRVATQQHSFQQSSPLRNIYNEETRRILEISANRGADRAIDTSPSDEEERCGHESCL